MIRDATVGPRRELALRIELWPEGQTFFGGGDVVSLRFGAIANYEEIERFFVKTPRDGLHYLRYLPESRPRHKIIEIEFDRSGDRIRIVAGNVSFGGKRVAEW